jgi:molecular chaperone DnaJ
MKSEYYYEILGIDKTANITRIKTAYRQKILQLHPNKNKEPNAAQKCCVT